MKTLLRIVCPRHGRVLGLIQRTTDGRVWLNENGRVYVVGEYRRQRAAEQLAHFSSEGTDVLVAVRRAFVSKAPVPVTEYDNWANAVEAVLRRIDATGSLVARFRSGAGLPLFPSQLEGDHQKYEVRVIARKARMNEFLAELR